MKKKKKVLFVCVHNSARSQIAEELLNRMCGDEYEAQSAGLEPGELNPLAMEVLREIGIEISGKETRSVFDVYKSGQMFSHVIAVCDGANAQRCPYISRYHATLELEFPGPFRH
jgi:arsenate reductase